MFRANAVYEGSLSSHLDRAAAHAKPWWRSPQAKAMRSRTATGKGNDKCVSKWVPMPTCRPHIIAPGASGTCCRARSLSPRPAKRHSGRQHKKKGDRVIDGRHLLHVSMRRRLETPVRSRGIHGAHTISPESDPPPEYVELAYDAANRRKRRRMKPARLLAELTPPGERTAPPHSILWRNATSA